MTLWLSYKQNIWNERVVQRNYETQKGDILISTKMWTIKNYLYLIFFCFNHLSFCTNHLTETQILMNSSICLFSHCVCTDVYYSIRKGVTANYLNRTLAILLQFSSELTFFLCKMALFLEPTSSRLIGNP